MRKLWKLSGQMIYPNRVEIVRIYVDREACMMCSLRVIGNCRLPCVQIHPSVVCLLHDFSQVSVGQRHRHIRRGLDQCCEPPLSHVLGIEIEHLPQPHPVVRQFLYFNRIKNITADGEQL